MLQKIQAIMAGMEEKMATSFLKLEERLDTLEEQAVNPLALIGLRFNKYLALSNLLGQIFHRHQHVYVYKLIK